MNAGSLLALVGEAWSFPLVPCSAVMRDTHCVPAPVCMPETRP